MTHHWLAYGNNLMCIGVDSHNRCAEVPPGIEEWQWRPFRDLVRYLECMGSVQHGELSGDDLLSWTGGRNERT